MKGVFDRAQVAQDAYSLAGEANASVDYFRRTRRIERIEVRNFKVIGDLDLEPAEPRVLDGDGAVADAARRERVREELAPPGGRARR